MAMAVMTPFFARTRLQTLCGLLIRFLHRQRRGFLPVAGSSPTMPERGEGVSVRKQRHDPPANMSRSAARFATWPGTIATTELNKTFLPSLDKAITAGY
jgi:hypothetical protein